MRSLPTLRTLLTAALIGLAPAAWAQDETRTAPGWVQGTIAQLGESLGSPAETIRQDAMQHIAYFAYFYGDDLDFTTLLPVLLDLYQNDPDERARLFAIVALHAIGDEASMQQMRRHASMDLDDEASARVKLVALAALMEHYGEGTFEGDEEVADLAKQLLEYYTSPRVIVEPPVILDMERM